MGVSGEPGADAAATRAWAFSIARNLALNHVRDGRRRGTPVELVETGTAPTQELALAMREALQRALAERPDLRQKVSVDVDPVNV